MDQSPFVHRQDAAPSAGPRDNGSNAEISRSIREGGIDSDRWDLGPTVEADWTSSTHYGIAGKRYERVSHVIKSTGLNRLKVDRAEGNGSVVEFRDPFQFIAKKDMAWYQDRGSKLHAAGELLYSGDLDEAALDPILAPYIAGEKKFIRDTRFIPLRGGIERLLWSEVLGIAGRADLIGTFFGSNRLALIDRKTTAVRKATDIQLALYALMLPFAFYEIDRYGLALCDDGTYDLVPFKDRHDKDDALAALRTYRKMEKN